MVANPFGYPNDVRDIVGPASARFLFLNESAVGSGEFGADRPIGSGLATKTEQKIREQVSHVALFTVFKGVLGSSPCI